ncbi:MAG: phosphatase [Actinobacteria bacterium]|nr:MAG: phosphatase [Actinomycetota bacterium]
MRTYKDLKTDLHIHSISSGHAYSSIAEIVDGAKSKGLKTIAITDHGPAMPGGAHLYHFNNLRVVDSNQDGLRVLKGVEANIIDAEGTLDIPDYTQEKLDLVLAAFHVRCGYEDYGAHVNTQTLIKALQNNRVHVIAHPGNPLFKLNYEKIAKVAKEMNILIEFNNGSYLKGTSRSGGEELDLEMALACRKYGTNVVITSDSHIASDIGNFEKAWDLVNKAGLSGEQILNLDNDRLLEFLKNR